MLAFAPQRHQPQDGGQRAGDREIGPEIDADQDRARDTAGGIAAL